MTEQRSRVEAGDRGLLMVLVAYSLMLGWILLWPSGEPATATVEHVHRVVLALGFSEGLITGGRVEFALNALMVAPVPLLATLLWPRWTWERWTAYAFVVSGSVELVQGLLLQQRSAQFVDVVANTFGVLVGATMAQWIVSRRSHGPASA